MNERSRNLIRTWARRRTTSGRSSVLLLGVNLSSVLTILLTEVAEHRRPRSAGSGSSAEPTRYPEAGWIAGFAIARARAVPNEVTDHDIHDLLHLAGLDEATLRRALERLDASIAVEAVVVRDARAILHAALDLAGDDRPLR
jgi:hypothetical protein